MGEKCNIPLVTLRVIPVLELNEMPIFYEFTSVIVAIISKESFSFFYVFNSIIKILRYLNLLCILYIEYKKCSSVEAIE